jgi:hypothetical protein
MSGAALSGKDGLIFDLEIIYRRSQTSDTFDIINQEASISSFSISLIGPLSSAVVILQGCIRGQAR